MILRKTLSRLVAIAPRRERVAAPFIALLLVSTAVGVAPVLSPVGTASAVHECDNVEQTVTFALGTTGQFLDKALRDGHCTESHRAQAIDDMQEADANQTELDIYNGVLASEAQSETSSAVFDNYLNDTESVAWMKAEIAIAEAYENGSSEAVARSKAKEAIARYYATKQENVLETASVHAQSTWVLSNRSQNEEGISKFYMWAHTDHGDGSEWDGKAHPSGTTNATYGLVNGEETTYTALEMDLYVNGGSDYEGSDTWTLNSRPSVYMSSISATLQQDTDLRVNPPNDNYEQREAFGYGPYSEKLNRIETMNNDLQSEVDPFVNETWDAYASGQIDSTEVLSRNTQMFEYGVDATNDSSRNLYNVVAALSSMGLDTPSIAGAGTMEVSYAGTTYDGLVMAREAPNGSWQAGETYNTSDIDGVVMLATTEGEQINMEGEFTIEAINAEDGTTVKQVNATKTIYKTSNTTELLNKMQSISDLRAQVEAYEARLEVKGSGGATSDGNGSGLLDSLAAFLGISAGAAVVVVLGVVALLVKIYSP